MGTARYTVIDGEVMAEKRGGVRSLYVPDPLGSTVALLDNTQAQTDTFSYWPYGENNVRTGTTPTPFQFVGTAGYYRDSNSRTYVRARTLDTQKGRWMTEDPIGFQGGDWNIYRYVKNSPVDENDSYGLGDIASNCCDKSGKRKTCKEICEIYKADKKSDLRFGAGVLCACGDKCTCIFGPPDLPKYYRIGQCPEIDKCLYEHETKHFPDVDCNPKRGIYRPPFRNPSDQPKSECTHRRETIGCLDKVKATGQCKKLKKFITDSEIHFMVVGGCMN